MTATMAGREFEQAVRAVKIGRHGKPEGSAKPRNEYPAGKKTRATKDDDPFSKPAKTADEMAAEINYNLGLVAKPPVHD